MIVKQIHLEEDFCNMLASSLSQVIGNGYREIKLPTINDAKLLNFSLPLSDISQKQVFYLSSSTDKKSQILRPEGTFVTFDMLKESLKIQPVQKVCYLGPMFRKEHRQMGRYNEFYQLGIEHTGQSSYLQVCETISTMWDIICSLNMENFVVVEINNIGTHQERVKYIDSLRKFVETMTLNQEQKQSFTSNPLRILDTKDSDLQKQLKSAPCIKNYISKSHSYENTLKSLEDLQIPYKENNRLVRGLDYYEGTVFEFVVVKVKTLINPTIGGGGEYSPSKMNPSVKTANLGCGAALGLERLYLAHKYLYPLKKVATKNVYMFIGDEESWLKATMWQKKHSLNKQHFKLNTLIRSDRNHVQLSRACKAKVLIKVSAGEFQIYNRDSQEFSVIEEPKLLKLIQDIS